eukprot:GILI01033743.1.p1 GENE.GILI01033743.1~~GILI01033743.1.p1  ORF type:complete len:275 (+),score=80.08 GILI01033743.1:30-827(+)
MASAAAPSSLTFELVSDELRERHEISAPTTMRYLVEHLEDVMGEWCVLEYKHIAKLVGATNMLIANIPREHSKLLPSEIPCTVKSVAALELECSRVCLLDMFSDKEICPEEKDVFRHYVFGGVLGDHPPKDKSGVIRSYCGGQFVRRVLGGRQMTLDTAVHFVKRIVEDQTPISAIPFEDDIHLKLDRFSTLRMPFRYMLDGKGKPIVPPGFVELQRKDEPIDDEFLPLEVADGGEGVDDENYEFDFSDEEGHEETGEAEVRRNQ